MEADERKRTKGEQLNLAIETADPNADIRTVLGSDFAYAASQGWVPGLQQRLRQRRTGDQPQSDPNVLYALQEGVYRAALGHEAAKAGLSAINPYDPTLPLALEDRARLADQQRAMLTGDKKAVSKVVTEAEFSEVVKRYQQTLDVSSSSEKGVAFSDAMRTWRDRFTEANGVEPSFTETRKQADQLTLKAAAVGSDWRGKRDPSREKQVLVAEVTRSDQIPVRYRKDIALELVRRGVPYSDEAAVRLYVGAVQAGEITAKE